MYAPPAYSIKPPGPSGNESPKPAKPTKPLKSPGYIKLKPHKKYVKIPIATILIFLNSIFTVFLDLVKPDSNAAKPKCIINTSKVETSIHVLLAVNIASAAP